MSKASILKGKYTKLENQIIATNGEIDLWHIEGAVYRSKSGAVLDIYGLPQDRRWECSLNHYLLYKDTVFNWLDEIPDILN